MALLFQQSSREFSSSSQGPDQRYNEWLKGRTLGNKTNHCQRRTKIKLTVAHPECGVTTAVLHMTIQREVSPVVPLFPSAAWNSSSIRFWSAVDTGILLYPNTCTNGQEVYIFNLVSSLSLVRAQYCSDDAHTYCHSIPRSRAKSGNKRGGYQVTKHRVLNQM